MDSRDSVDERPRVPLRRRVGDRWVALRRGLLRRRRLIAALCVAGATVVGLRSVAPPPPETVEVLVASRDLPAGAVLTEGDLRVTEVGPDSVPASVVDAPVGATLAAPLREGEAVTDVRLVGPQLVEAAPGTTAVPVRFSDAAQAALLEVGDRVDVLATDPQERVTTTVSYGAVVLAVPATDDGHGALAGRVVVLGIPDADVQQVTSSAVTSFVTYAWRNR
ncbi:Flp pilus assembly protein CpaB [Nocardioides thalensis]|uniref:Flp pilus assembly protein CpaB n=1 Tax=Nocardioides thalensis TaxID=1914755 RepID=A0A853BV84_9ACTN|nr:SAF domain-containing protein [Nocardioides thalensis]NYI99779.1 Flp pilus assembly protein CpaB [Nocardioides thalensis]